MMLQPRKKVGLEISSNKRVPFRISRHKKILISDLRRMYLFQKLNDAELGTLTKLLHYLPCKKRHLVIHEGTVGNSIYLVKSGQLRVSHVIRGKRRQLATVHPGDHFGEVSFIDKQPRSASIYASKDSELLVLTQQTYEQVLSKRPKLLKKIMEALIQDLCTKLRKRNEILDCDLSDLLPAAIFELNTEGNISFANRNGLSLFGYSESDFVDGLNLFQMLPPEERERFLQHLQKNVKDEFRQNPIECSVATKQGKFFPAAIHCDAIFKAEKISGWRVTILDISERKRIEEALRQARDGLELRVQERTALLQESEQRYALAVEGANDGIWDWNLIKDEIYFSPRWKAMINHKEDEIGISPDEWFQRIHPDDVEQVKRLLMLHRRGATPHFETEYRILCGGKTFRWMLCRGLAIRNEEGIVCRIAGSQTDITDRRRLQEELSKNAFYDSLTGLPNRALFIDRLSQSFDRMNKGRKYLFAVVYLDLDRFKVVNDSLGHILGDQLLVLVSQRLSASIRPGDTVARLGGDEFAILLNEIKDAQNPVRVAKSILNGFTSPFHLGTSQIFVTASIGIAYSSRYIVNARRGSTSSAVPQQTNSDYERPEEMLRDADIAMYRAKAQGKSCFEIFDNEMHARAHESLRLETDLRLGIERHEYKLHYQPIVSLRTGRIAGFEALLRWHHPIRGLVSPSEFVSLTEENGLIVPIGKQVLLDGCQQLMKWNIQYPESPFFVSVNVSGRQLMQHNFLDHMKEILNETGINPGWLKLEITESIMMENRETTLDLLPQLKDLGVDLSLDDFGTGYSSLSSLRHFPIDSLKVDRSFVSGMASGVENLQIVSTIIGLARNLEMNVIAEGVEHLGELMQLRALKCDYAQGYYFSKPLGATLIQDFLSKNPQW